ncbi:DUF3889 domain-containing protein [Ornithinibacillus halophilus]|uniref:Rare lipoprotein A n=1 Tax=Ornithinibacillus halophilus TaxID=930117 RepID=A0A1M5FL55_9BACI|nr:DUF3889 domain-containing protein [Ornithinibacillus halophilus]SHF92238.1 rare lipoprotein A [Ornithinibacillus halophilus]
MYPNIYYNHPCMNGYRMIPNPYYWNSYVNPYQVVNHDSRQQTIRGQARWTKGGTITKCNLPWSSNEYMTAAVGEDAPYACGQSIKVGNPSIPGREVIVTVVDTVPGYSQNQINLHRRAFEALGVDLSVGVIDVDITPEPQLEEEKWGKYLLEVVQIAYPGYEINEYNSVGKTQLSSNQTRESFDYVIQSDSETIRIRGNVVYNPNTDRVISFDLVEIANNG